MRRIIGSTAVAASMVVVVLVARTGYVSSGVPVIGTIVAVISALLAIGSLIGPAMAVYVWPRSRASSILVAFLALLAFGTTLSITLAAINGGVDEAPVELIVEPVAQPVSQPIAEPIVEPMKVADPFAEDRDALDRIERELASLRDYEMITAAVVEAANAAAIAASESREEACASNGRGTSSLCSQREADERLALAAVAEAKKNRAATERVNVLRAEHAMIERRLAEAPPPVIETPRMEAPTPVIMSPPAKAVVSEDLQNEVPEHAPIFEIPDVATITAATWKKFALAAFMELLISCAFVAFALMRPNAPQPAASSPKLTPNPLGRGLSRGRHVSALSPTRRVYEYVVDRLEERGGTAIPFSDVYLDYEAWSKHHRTPALTPYDFSERMSLVFKGTNVFTRERNDIIQLVNVRFAGST